VGWVRRPRGDRNWEARYRGPDGRERSRSFATKRGAQQFLARVETQKQRGEWLDPALGRVTFANWAFEWTATTVDLRPSTRDLYAYLLRRHVLPTFGPRQLGRITTLDVRGWLAELSATDLSPSTVRKAYRVLSRIMSAAVESGFIGRSPCASVRPPAEPSHEMRFLTANEVSELAAAIGPHDSTLVFTAAYTGLRWGELAGLRRRRINLMRRTVTVVEQLTEVNGTLAFGAPKTAAGKRSVTISTFLVPLLEEQLGTRSEAGRDGLVFPAAEGGPMRRSNFRRRTWTPATREVGLHGVRFHDLRHTAVALAIEAGAHPRALMERLGHSSVTVTLGRYGHLLPGQDEAIAARLDAAFAAAYSAQPATPTVQNIRR
jgi:integrase